MANEQFIPPAAGSHNSKLKLAVDMLKCILVLLPIIILTSFGTGNFDLINDQLIYEKLGGDINQNKTFIGRYENGTCTDSLNQTTEDDIQKRASRFKLYMQIGYSLTLFISVPLWGALSDQMGRYVVIIGSAIGALCKLSSFLAVTVSEHTPIWILIIGEIAHAVFGKSLSGMILVCAAHIADVIPKGDRTIGMILVDFFLLSAATGSQLACGYWIRSSGFTPIIIASMTAEVLVLLYGAFIYRKITRPILDDTGHDETMFNKFKSYFTKTFRTFTRKRIGYTRACMLFLLSMSLTQAIAMYGVDLLFNIYTLGPPFCWNSVTLGIFSGIKYALHGTMALFVGFAFIKAGPTAWLIFVGLVSSTASVVVFGFATTTTLLYVGMICGGLRILIPAVTRSILSDLAEPTEVGSTMAGYLLTGVAAELISPSVFNYVYSATISVFNRTIFFLSAGLYIAAIMFLSGYAVSRRKTQKYSHNLYSKLAVEDSVDDGEVQ